MKPKCWSCETENPEYDERGFCTVCDAPKENPDDEHLFDEQIITKPENVIVVPPAVL